MTTQPLRCMILALCSLLMPSLFFAVLYWRDLRLVHRAGCITLLVVGVCLGTAIVARDLDALLHQLRTSGAKCMPFACIQMGLH